MAVFMEKRIRIKVKAKVPPDKLKVFMSSV